MNSKYSVGPCVVQMCHICMFMAYSGIIFKHQLKHYDVSEVLQKLLCDDIRLFTESCIEVILAGNTRRKYV